MRTKKIKLVTVPLWLFYFLMGILLLNDAYESITVGVAFNWNLIGVFLTLACLMFINSMDYTISDQGIIWGSWILRLLRIRQGCWVFRPWSKVYIRKAMYWGFTLFPGPYGHVTPWLYTKSWEFMEEASKRALRTEPRIRDLIQTKATRSASPSTSRRIKK